jgi:hypothetical protein
LGTFTSAWEVTYLLFHVFHIDTNGHSYCSPRNGFLLLCYLANIIAMILKKLPPSAWVKARKLKWTIFVPCNLFEKKTNNTIH